MMHNCLQTIPLFVYLITNPDSTVQYSTVSLSRFPDHPSRTYSSTGGDRRRGKGKRWKKEKKRKKKEKKGENKSQSEILETGEPEILTTTDKRKQQAIPCPHAARN
jgi:hypothetical protein